MATRQSERLSEKRQAPPEPSAPPPAVKKKKKTVAESCREYKERIKADSDKYEHYKESARQYSRAYRSTLTEDQKQHQREQSRIRMKAMRERRKQEAPLLTRATQEEKRAQWREEKKRQAEKMTPQKRRRVNERRRQRYQEKKMLELLAKNAVDVNAASQEDIGNNQEPSASNGPQVQTPAAQRKALSRAKAALPKSPSKYVRVVQDLQKKASPRKKALFQVAHVSPESARIGEAVKKQLSLLKRTRSQQGNFARRVLLSVCRGAHKSIRGQASTFGVHRKTLVKPEKEAVKKERKLEQDIGMFLESTATVLPSKKSISKKSGAAAAVLRKPLAELHKEFQESHGVTVSYAHFARCRPKHIRPARRNFLRQCLCEYCENVNLKIKTVNSMAARHNNICRIRHVYHAVDLVTCGRQDGLWKKECAFRECDACKDGTNLDVHLRPLPDDDVTWTRWESRPVVVNGKTVSRKMLVRKNGNLTDLQKELKDEVLFLATHLFRADWQYQQFNTLRQLSPFPQGTVVMVLDFAENFTCSSQDEVQAAHWHHEQVTVHPTVTYYACKDCGERVTESLVFISDDKDHDYDAVHKFTTLAVKHLREARGLEVSNIVEWTDGCAAQYKSKGPFADISHSLTDHNCTLERNFFGSRHGKGPSDGESAVVKSAATRAVKGGTVITDAQELYDFCKGSALNKQPGGERMCEHSLRTFFYVKKEDIARKRNRAVATLKGTRSLHTVKCVENNVLLTRMLSCSCLACRSGVGRCENEEIAGLWEERALKPIRARANRPAAPPTPLNTPTSHPDNPPNPGSVSDAPPANSSAPPVPPTCPNAPPPPATGSDAPTTNPNIPPAPAAGSDALITIPNAPPAPATGSDAPPVPATGSDAPATNPNVPPAPAAGSDALITNPNAPPAPATGSDAPPAPATGYDDPTTNPNAPTAPATIPNALPAPDYESPTATNSLAPMPHVNDFILVRVQGRQRMVNFHAKVIQIDDNELEVHYLTKKPGTDLFIWSDTAWVSAEDVVKKLPPPALAPGRGVAFRFVEH